MGLRRQYVAGAVRRPYRHAFSPGFMFAYLYGRSCRRETRMPFSGCRDTVVEAVCRTRLRQFLHGKYKIHPKAIKVMKGL